MGRNGGGEIVMIKENEENWEIKSKGLDEIESSWDEGWKIGDLEIKSGRFPKKYRMINGRIVERRIEDCF